MKLMKLGFLFFSCNHHVSKYFKCQFLLKSNVNCHCSVIIILPNEVNMRACGQAGQQIRRMMNMMSSRQRVVRESKWLTLFLLQWLQMGGREILHAHLLLDSRTGVKSTGHQREVYSILWRWVVLEIWDGIKSKNICKDTQILLCHESIPRLCEVNVAGKLVFLKFLMNDRLYVVYGDIDLGKTWHSLLIEFWNKTWLREESIILA
jgi:hypothetical protein